MLVNVKKTPVCIRILFICYENICRSPMAAGIFFSHAERHGLGHLFSVESAGTRSYQQGSSPDPRAAAAAFQLGVAISSNCARGIDALDLFDYDWIFVMDNENYEEICLLTGFVEKPKVRLVMSFVPGREEEEIQDPYYGTHREFEQVRDDLFLASDHILRNLVVSCEEGSPDYSRNAIPKVR
ncbi:protein tyrosine phosphatase [Chlorobium limicola DSM 245]|uniref:protein-tyrosine-phosphatase n=1 Tax=Chlorobium limicola (strain DSM 245 / NBRC 103803 / 6330) TaxID=290315 RepID=B3EFV1_CHLL2|nr:protein tyrosine phosphatase [Chlorobium limicola DSM 245]